MSLPETSLISCHPAYSLVIMPVVHNSFSSFLIIFYWIICLVLFCITIVFFPIYEKLSLPLGKWRLLNTIRSQKLKLFGCRFTMYVRFIRLQHPLTLCLEHVESYVRLTRLEHPLMLSLEHVESFNRFLTNYNWDMRLLGFEYTTSTHQKSDTMSNTTVRS